MTQVIVLTKPFKECCNKKDAIHPLVSPFRSQGYGSGKSTLLRSLNLLVSPDSGQIQMGDKHINAATLTRKQTAGFRRQTSIVFQHYNLFKNKTALENITENLRFTQKLTQAQACKRGHELLAQAGLAHKSAAYPGTLSGAV